MRQNTKSEKSRWSRGKQEKIRLTLWKIWSRAFSGHFKNLVPSISRMYIFRNITTDICITRMQLLTMEFCRKIKTLDSISLWDRSYVLFADTMGWWSGHCPAFCSVASKRCLYPLAEFSYHLWYDWFPINNSHGKIISALFSLGAGFFRGNVGPGLCQFVEQRSGISCAAASMYCCMVTDVPETGVWSGVRIVMV